jgi:hypothetical protein
MWFASFSHFRFLQYLAVFILKLENHLVKVTTVLIASFSEIVYYLFIFYLFLPIACCQDVPRWWCAGFAARQSSQDG